MREQEVCRSMSVIGVSSENVHFLRIPERRVLDQLDLIVRGIIALAQRYSLDCVVGQDYEGGHEAHDAISFCASEIVRLLRIQNHFVFPLYHGKPQERKGARFKPSRVNIISLLLSSSEKLLKERVLPCRDCLQLHFDGLTRSAEDYYALLLEREVYYRVKILIVYTERPLAEVGYEFHRNGFTFADFLKAIEAYYPHSPR